MATKKTKIKTYAEACKKLGIKASALPDVSMLPLKDRKAIVSHYKLTKVVEALNDGWKPNWNDSNQSKYVAWLRVQADEKRPAGFGFSHTHYDHWFTATICGSRLCFKSSELALYAAKQFSNLYKDYFLFKN